MRISLLAPFCFALAMGFLSPAAGPAAAQDELRAAAVVNDEVISVLDVSIRTRLSILAAGLRDTPETRQRMGPQVLRTIIDERLQLQEAKRLGIEISAEQVEASIDRLAQQNNTTVENFLGFLDKNGVPPDYLRDQIRAQLSWQTVMIRTIRSNIVISPEEIDSVVARMRSAEGTIERRVAEIFLAVDEPEQEAEVYQSAIRLLEQLQSGASFPALARQFSQSATAAGGGEMGWVQQDQLDPELSKVLAGMNPGEVAGPVRTLSGYYILHVLDQQKVTLGDVTVALKQALFALPLNPGTEKIEEARRKAAEVRSRFSGCESFNEVAQEVGSPASGDVGKVKLTDIPPNLRPAVESLEVGEISEPVVVTGGVALLMVCERSGGEVNRQAIEQQLVTQQLDLQARRYMRDIRRQANVDLRV